MAFPVPLLPFPTPAVVVSGIVPPSTWPVCPYTPGVGYSTTEGRLGGDVEPANWQKPASSAGGVIGSHGYANVPTASTRGIGGGSRWLRYVGRSFLANHWAFANCVIPMGTPAGGYPAVRVDPLTLSGYALVNGGGYGSELDPPGQDYLGLYLVRWRNGVSTVLWNGYMPFERVSDGYPTPNYSGTNTAAGWAWWDSFGALLEVVGTNPVRLRMTWMPAEWDRGPTTLPRGVREVIGGVDGPELYWTADIEDSSADRLTDGGPGIYTIGGENEFNNAGAAWNFLMGDGPEFVDSNPEPLPLPLTTTPPAHSGIVGAGALRKATGQFYQLNSYSGSAGWKHAPLMVSDGSQWK